MASAKQIEANRRNGAKSKGPRTPEGKARSKMNALRHGFSSSEWRRIVATTLAQTNSNVEARFTSLLQKEMEIDRERWKHFADAGSCKDNCARNRHFARAAALGRYSSKLESAKLKLLKQALADPSALSQNEPNRGPGHENGQNEPNSLKRQSGAIIQK